MQYILALIVAGQIYLNWLFNREQMRRAEAKIDKLLDRIQTGSAEKAALMERQRDTPPAPRKIVVDFPGLEGVEMSGERG